MNFTCNVFLQLCFAVKVVIFLLVFLKSNCYVIVKAIVMIVKAIKEIILVLLVI